MKKYGKELFVTDTDLELDRLRAVNADLLAALEAVMSLLEGDESPHGARGDQIIEQAAAAIARAKEQK